MTQPPAERFILRGQCRDEIGIVADVATFLSTRRLFILESEDYGDPASGEFFFRIVFSPRQGGFRLSTFKAEFSAVAQKWAMTYDVRDAARKPNVLILVSKADHCLNDLLYRQRIGALPMNVPAIVSNHLDCAWLAERHGLPYHHLPVPPDRKAEAEQEMLDLADASRADLVILARYMQVLSDATCRQLEGRCINIHHSFLPGFKGARPYRQAFQRGVKLIGATAHYVTPDLDEGPIITQAVERTSHADTAEAMAAIGRDTEARVLAQAVKLHIEGRVFINGNRTVVLA